MDAQAARIQEIIDTEDIKESKYKTIDVFKEVEPVTDVGSLYLNDLQPVDAKKLKANPEDFLNSLARDNAQLLFKKIWQLPIERVDNVITCTLPAPTILLPREKKIPKPKPPTRWEQFAKDRGIANKKRNRMVYDEESEGWKPRYGYKRGNDDTKEWCVEVPVNSEPNEDQFEKRTNDKKERIAKNELQRLSNINRNKKASGMDMVGKVDHKKAKENIEKEINLAKSSTASLGKFQERLPKEKESKKKGLKRKFESVTGNFTSEKQRALDVWDKINKKPAIDVTKGVNKHIANEQMNNNLNGKKKTGKVKNQRFRKGAKAAGDKKKFGKGKTLGKKR